MFDAVVHDNGRPKFSVNASYHLVVGKQMKATGLLN
jgi:hypothetical protein